MTAEKAELESPNPLLVDLWPTAGKMLGLSRGLTYEMARQGKIPVMQFGRRKKVPLARLKAMTA